MVEKCIAAPSSVRFDIFYVVSNNKWSDRDLEHARAVVGYEPQDRAEDHRSRYFSLTQTRIFAGCEGGGVRYAEAHGHVKVSRWGQE